MGEKEKKSLQKILGLYFGYILLFAFTAVLAFSIREDRTMSSPVAMECTAAPKDCPARSFCYRMIDASIFGEELYNVTDADNNPLYKKEDIEADAGLIRYVCACYALYGEGGLQPLPGDPNEDNVEYCTTDEPYKGTLLVLNYVVLVFIAVTLGQTHLTMYQLIQVDALQFNASGITMVFTALASVSELVLMIVYLVELQGLTDPAYIMNDTIRPTAFGYFAVSLMSAMMEVSLMWADVYMKSKKMGADNDTIAKLKKVVFTLIVMTFFMIVGPLLVGLTLVAGAWAALLLITISIAYWRKGKQLSGLLMPPDANAPGASSAKAAADQILATAKSIPGLCAVFILFLGAHFVTVQRPATKSISMICVFGFLLTACALQVKLLLYVKFGARKKLHKAGYKGFRSSAMSAMTSTVAPSEDEGSVASTVSSA
ncbi:hypothetical protein TrRE_jg11441 [Triparma retinervis]|uniref:Transmembrane protein n=1 Tax=Triparma retinervis TaxID=2557542 RepID=A0A9W7G0Q5_9STRA|nr:hypothetical protein TrRE_jg11441 [Triparma retinervis]